MDLGAKELGLQTELLQPLSVVTLAADAKPLQSRPGKREDAGCLLPVCLAVLVLCVHPLHSSGGKPT